MIDCMFMFMSIFCTDRTQHATQYETPYSREAALQSCSVSNAGLELMRDAEGADVVHIRGHVRVNDDARGRKP